MTFGRTDRGVGLSTILAFLFLVGSLDSCRAPEWEKEKPILKPMGELPRPFAIPPESEFRNLSIHLLKAEEIPTGFTVRVEEMKVRNLEALCLLLKDYSDQYPEGRVTIIPGVGIQFEHVFKVVNECMRAGMTRVRFAGVPQDPVE